MGWAEGNTTSRSKIVPPDVKTHKLSRRLQGQQADNQIRRRLAGQQASDIPLKVLETKPNQSPATTRTRYKGYVTPALIHGELIIGWEPLETSRLSHQARRLHQLAWDGSILLVCSAFLPVLDEVLNSLHGELLQWPCEVLCMKFKFIRWRNFP